MKDFRMQSKWFIDRIHTYTCDIVGGTTIDSVIKQVSNKTFLIKQKNKKTKIIKKLLIWDTLEQWIFNDDNPLK